MKYYFHTGSRKIELVDVDPKTKVGEVLERFLSGVNLPQNAQGLKCNVYQEDVDEALPESKSFDELEISEKSHLHIGVCKNVRVTVHYAGMQFSDTFNSSNSLRKVFQKASKYFNVPEEDKASLHLYLSANDEDKVEFNEHVGDIVSGTACEVQLYLSVDKGILG